MITDIPGLSPTHSLRQARPGILSVLSTDDEGARYDTRAAAYDRVVGSPIYNRIVWSASTDRYRAFARKAVTFGSGPVLEAGCGSAVFTAEAHARTDRPTVLVDRSIDMLEAARNRLEVAAGGALPPTVHFLQADLLDLPFEPATFGSVLSMGTLHLFASVEAVVRSLTRVRGAEGALFLSGLHAETMVGKRYLALLRRAGEVAAPRRFAEVRTAVEAVAGVPVAAEREGSMGYYTACAA